MLVATLRDLQATHDRRDREQMDIEGGLQLARARKIEELERVYVVDHEARPVSEDVLRPIDPMQDPPGTYVVVVDRVGPQDDEDRLGLVVRSPIVAGEIRDRFRRFAIPGDAGGAGDAAPPPV